MAAKKGKVDRLPLCLAGLVLAVVFLSTVQMMVYLKSDTTHALHFVAGEQGVPGLVWNGSHHVQTKAHSVEFGAAPALRGRSMAASSSHSGAGHRGSKECHLGGPFGGFIKGCSKGCAEYESFATASAACQEEPTCGGITSQNEKRFQLRAMGETLPSPTGSEMSYRKFCAEISNPPPVVESPPPPEWEQPVGYEQDYETAGTTVDGEPTIFISIASYRDDLCHNTIKEALRMAEHPQRIFFGAVEQSIPSQGDLPCNFTMVPCDADPSQLLCVHSSQISVDRVDARGAQGPTYGRFRADRLYRGEYFALQIDAHMYFVANWDTQMIHQWNATGNEYAVLTTYPSDYKPGSIVGKGVSHHKTTPVICKSMFQGDGMVRHMAAGEIYPSWEKVKESPILQPVWAAGSSFSRGHRVARVPYGLLPTIFQGEETVMALRMWTSGYDFYTFHRVLLFHTYDRKTRPKLFWENKADNGLKTKTVQSIEIMLGLRRPPAGYDVKDISPGAKYGLGLKRKLSTFSRLWGYDFKHRKSRDNCKWAYSMDMHVDLTAYLRPDGRGIDYSKVPVDDILRRQGLSEVPPQDLAWP